MKKNIYLIFIVIGLLVPWVTLISRYTINEPVTHMFDYLFMNAYSASFTADLTVSIIVFAIFVIHETQRLKMKYAFLYILAVLIGLAFALPLFLYFREQKLAQLNDKNQT